MIPDSSHLVLLHGHASLRWCFNIRHGTDLIFACRIDNFFDAYSHCLSTRIPVHKCTFEDPGANPLELEYEQIPGTSGEWVQAVRSYEWGEAMSREKI